MLFVYEIIKRDFPVAAAAYAPGCVYGSVTNDNLAKGIVRVLDMLLVLFVFGYGKSPFLNDGKRAAALLAVALLITEQQRRAGCQRRRICAVHLDR